MIAEIPAPSVAKPFQAEFDWQIGHARPWLLTDEIKAALECSDNHVRNLFDDGEIDVVIDIKSIGARRPCYRVLRESFFRHVTKTKEPTDLENVIAGYLRHGPSVLRSWNIAAHFRCSEDHVCELASEFTDISSANSTRVYIRATGLQMINFAKARRIA